MLEEICAVTGYWNESTSASACRKPPWIWPEKDLTPRVTASRVSSGAVSRIRTTVFFPAIPRKSVSIATGKVPTFVLIGRGRGAALPPDEPCARAAAAEPSTRPAAATATAKAALTALIENIEPRKGRAAFPPARVRAAPRPRGASPAP